MMRPFALGLSHCSIRTAVVVLAAHDEAWPVSCPLQGKYEVWWVMRTLYEFIVERRIPFTVISPECDWDGTNNRYLPYATLYNGDGSRKARALSGEYSRPRCLSCAVVVPNPARHVCPIRPQHLPIHSLRCPFLSPSGLHPFDPEKLLFTRPRTEGTPARPGVGMGSTLVPITDTWVHNGARSLCC